MQASAYGVDRLDMTGIIFRTSGSGPPLVALHAFPLNSGMWESQMAALRKSAAWYAPDLPGFGASASAEPIEGLEALATAIAAELRDRGISEAAVMGCSMGGYLAFALLRLAPSLVRALILVNTKAIADSEQVQATRLATAARAEQEGCGFLVHEWPQSALSPATLRDRPHVVEAVRAMVAQATPAGVAAAQRAMAGRPDSTPLLSDISVPTMVVHGIDDRFIQTNDAHEMAAAIANGRFLPVPGAGHLPNLEQPAIVNEALESFLAEAASQSSSRL